MSSSRERKSKKMEIRKVLVDNVLDISKKQVQNVRETILAINGPDLNLMTVCFRIDAVGI